MRAPLPQVSSSSPESQLGLSEEAHILAFVWDASKLPIDSERPLKNPSNKPESSVDHLSESEPGS
ncbi:hypothetical protein JOQ06_000850, partial [Pogonophryne albipinna]